MVRARLDEGLRPVVVHSALSGITDRLEQLLARALTGDWEPVMEQIERRHCDLSRDLGLPISAELEHQFAELRKMASGIHLIGEVSDRLRARVMATGELMATRIGAAYLAAEGLDVQWLDARTVLHAEERPGATARASYLSATCNFEPDPALQQRLAQPAAACCSRRASSRATARARPCCSAAAARTPRAATSRPSCTRAASRSGPTCRACSPPTRAQVPNARLLKSLDYDEAQEIASSGAKVLHPRCILPVKQYSIPLSVHATQRPDLEGTVVTATGGDGGARVKAVCTKKGITLISMDTLGMWHQVGFLGDAFAVFKEHGLSVDLVSTSETTVTVSLDPAANALDARALEALVTSLAKLCRVEVIGPCAAVSLVGRSIRATLHRLGDALELFEEQRIYLVTQAANDLNITFVVDEEQGDRLVSRLHDVIVRNAPSDHVLGPTWEQIQGLAPAVPAGRTAVVAGPARRARSASPASTAAPTSTTARPSSRRRGSCSRSAAWSALFYAIKANPHPDVLRLVAGARLRLRVRVAGRVRARDRDGARHRPRPDPVHAQLRAALGVRVGPRERRARHARQPLPAARLARAVPRPRRAGARRHQLRPRPPRPRAHRRRALEVRHPAVRARRARAAW